MKIRSWNNWFAWRPVAFGPHIVWLKTIQRSWNTEEACWYFRRVPKV